jgi:hypothetical protein
MSLRLRLRKSDMSALMVDEILGNSSVESPIEMSMVLAESHDISPLKRPNSSFDMLGVQHIISLEQHVKLFDPLPHARDKEDEDNPSLLDCVHTISTQVSNNICLIPHPQSFSVHSYKPEKLIEHLPYLLTIGCLNQLNRYHVGFIICTLRS